MVIIFKDNETMPISDKDKKKHFESVCLIFLDKVCKGKTISGLGNGVFITPSHVLTSWHVISGSPTDSIIFQNHAGQYAKLKKGGFKKRCNDTDLCLMEIDSPIGKGHCTRPINTHILKDEARPPNLGALFAKHTIGNKTVIENILSIKKNEDLNFERLSYDLSPENDSNEVNTIYTIKESVVHSGHSGAPILDSDGHIISITSSIHTYEIPKLGKLISSDTIIAPSPQQIAEFVDDFLFSPESTHQPEQPA